MNHKDRPLWTRKADTNEGDQVLNEARTLSMCKEYQHLSDGELIRLAYWGASGDSNE